MLENTLNAFSVALNCVKIGQIISFNKEEQTADVQIMHKQTNSYNIQQNELVEYPVLGKVPVVMLGGSQTYITHPVNAGDQCLLLFNDYMIDGWWATGQPNPSDFPRKHDISDAIAVVGLRALPNAIQSFSDYLNLHYSDNSSIVIGNTVEVNNQTINLNGDTNVTGNEMVTGSVTAPTLNATLAANGSFRTSDNKTVTVVNGIVTLIQ